MVVINKKSFNRPYIQIPANPIRLIFELLLCILLIIPAILWTILKLFFRTPRKNIKGQVVLVSTHTHILTHFLTNTFGLKLFATRTISTLLCFFKKLIFFLIQNNKCKYFKK